MRENAVLCIVGRDVAEVTYLLLRDPVFTA
jgi:hypothetical protein